MTEEPEILIDEDHVYTVNGVKRPSVTTILKDLGFVDFSFVPPDKLEAARIRGSAVHDCIWFLEDGDLDWSSVHPEVKPYLDAYLLFKEECGYTNRERERKVFSEQMNFCGRLDATGELAKLAIENALIDFKSGAPQPATKWQTAAYAIAIDNPFIPRCSLHLQKTGRYKLVWHRDYGDINAWKYICATWHLRKSCKRQ